jgi:3-oxoacyl-[acyl-carrier-protein] synthase-3
VEHPESRPVLPVGLTATGAYVPDRILSNQDLERMVDTSDEWIVSRTGMRERRIVAPGEAASDLAVKASERALADSKLEAKDIELIIVATVTPDNVCPPTACYVQEKLGVGPAVGFDLSAACSGFANALLVGQNLIATGAFANALVIGVDILSCITDYEDRESCILFGDGAGAVVLEPDPGRGILLDHLLGIDGSGAEMIIMPAGGSRKPSSKETVEAREHYLKLNGRQVFRFAVSKMREIAIEVTGRNGFTVDDVDLFVPHQANLRIIESAAEKLNISKDRILVNIERTGNTSSASIPMALDEAVRTDRLKKGDLVCMVAFGGGLSWGASLMRW